MKKQAGLHAKWHIYSEMFTEKKQSTNPIICPPKFCSP